VNIAGDRCEVDIDDCATATCANNGTCIDGMAEYTCLCSPGFRGVICDEDIDECASAPCYNNATCHDSINSVVCVLNHLIQYDTRAGKMLGFGENLRLGFFRFFDLMYIHEDRRILYGHQDT